MSGKQRLVYPSIAIASFATLLFELAQTRILSYIFWNHIVYLTVALALLGFGISGTLVSIWGKQDEQYRPAKMSLLWMGFGLSMIISVGLTSWLLPYLTGLPELAKLSFCYAIFVTPFIFSGAILTITFAHARERVGRLYAVDMVFAGLACILFFWLLPLLGAVEMICLLSGAALLMGYLWSEEHQTKSQVVNLGTAMAMGICFVGLLMRPGFLDFRPEQYKEMASMMSNGSEKTNIESTTWTPLARIDVVGNDQKSLLEYDEHPEGSYKIITQDGSAHTRLLSRRALDQLRQEVKDNADDHVFNMVYQIKKSPEVAVIGVGGGIDVAYALAYGASAVTGIELNPAIYKYAREVYAEYTGGLLSDPKLTLLNAEGRAAIASLDRQFDVIQINAIDTFAALSSGAYVLSESNLYTVEAFEDIFAKLKDNGVLSMHRWLFVPPRETLRLTVLASEAMRRQGIPDSGKRIFVIGRGDWAIMLVKKQPFTKQEVETIYAQSSKIDSHIYYWPKVDAPARQKEREREYYASAPETTVEAARIFNDCIGAYEQGKEDEFFASYVYNVTPTTSDSPFFFEYNFRNLFGIAESKDMFRDTLRVDAGATLFLMLIQSTIFILLAVFWPLWKFHRRGMRFEGAASWSVYFAGIGFGFMIVEIVIIQKCVLFLGNPMYSLSVVLASILMSAGLGSALVARSGWTVRQVIDRVGLSLVALLVLGSFSLTPLFTSLLHLPLLQRVLVVVGITLPMGLLMGMLFPAGLQAIRNLAPGFVPWAWGISGCASVYGSIVAILIAIVHGFSTALYVGIAFYAVGFLVLRFGLSAEGHRKLHDDPDRARGRIEADGSLESPNAEQDVPAPELVGGR